MACHDPPFQAIQMILAGWPEPTASWTVATLSLVIKAGPVRMTLVAGRMA